MSPSEISFENQAEVYESLYPNNPHTTKFSLNIGDKVQIVMDALPFGKSCHGYFSDKIYTVIKRHPYSVARYSISDDNDSEPISGTFYDHELLAY